MAGLFEAGHAGELFHVGEQAVVGEVDWDGDPRWERGAEEDGVDAVVGVALIPCDDDEQAA